MVAGLAFALVLGLACPLRLPTWVALLSLCVGVLAAYVGRHVRARLWSLPLIVVAFAAGASGQLHARTVVQPGLYRFEGRVVALRHGEDTRCTVEVERAHALNGGGALAGAKVAMDCAVPVGGRLRALARVQPVTQFRNPSPHPRSSPRIDGFARVRGEIRVLHAPSSVLEGARSALRQRLNTTLPRHAAGVARALLLGDSAAVDPVDREAVRDAGLAHLLAVSGLHVALVIGVVVWLSRRWIRGRHALRWAAAMGASAAIGFALMAGGTSSAWRAALMAAVAAALVAVHRRPRAVSVVGAAALVFAIAEPERATSPAFLLSICATGAIVTMRRQPTTLRTAWVVSVRTTIATAPLVAWHFGSVPILGVIANVALVPVAALLLLPLAFVHAGLSSLGLDWGSAQLFTTVLDALVAAASWFSSVGWGLNLPPLSQAQGFGLAIGCFVLLALQRPKHQLVALVLLVSSMGALEWHLRATEQPREELRVTVVDVGQGDGSIVDLPDGSAMLVDAGGGIPDPGERALLPLLQARRRASLRLVVISHPHPDHYAGLRALLDHIDIEEIWDSGQAEDETPHGPAARLLRRARQMGIVVRTAQDLCGEHQVGGARLDVVWPCPRFDAGLGPNDNSLVVRITHRARSVLFTGDVEALAEAELVHMDVRAELLKVPHHGSRTSSSEAFLRAVSPTQAAVSCGRNNRYGHPHPEVVSRYEALGIPLLRTDAHGGVIFVGTDEGWR